MGTRLEIVWLDLRSVERRWSRRALEGRVSFLFAVILV